VRGLRNPRFWSTCTAGWLFLALAEATSLHFDALRAGRESHLGLLVLERCLAGAIWVLVAAVVFALAPRAMAAGAGAARIAVRFALLGAILVPLCTVSSAVSYGLVRAGHLLAGPAEIASTVPLTTLMWHVFIYSMLVLASCAFFLSRRSRRQEQEKSDLRARLALAELEFLRAQLEPHFLFNALNSVAGLIRGARHELATVALAQLSQLLRYVIEASRQERVPLAWELEFVGNYLELQQIRYGSRLRFAIEGDAAARSCDVPPLLMQPLIENAVVHGVARTSEAASIEIRVRISPGDSALRVEVRNTLDEGAPAARAGTGVGLSNTRQRLHRIYGDAFRLDAGPDGPAAYRVALSLPGRRAASVA
jgi:two-component system, LytTR family, sensor kinase